MITSSLSPEDEFHLSKQGNEHWVKFYTSSQYGSEKVCVLSLFVRENTKQYRLCSSVPCPGEELLQEFQKAYTRSTQFIADNELTINRSTKDPALFVDLCVQGESPISFEGKKYNPKEFWADRGSGKGDGYGYGNGYGAGVGGGHSFGVGHSQIFKY